METSYAFAYVRKGIAGRPVDEYDVQLIDDEPNKPYWIVELTPVEHNTRATIYVYFDEGQQPPDSMKDNVENQVKRLVSQKLFRPK